MSSNIAEGTGRRTRADLRQFLHVALGSAREAECLLLFSRDIGFLTARDAQQLIDEAGVLQGMLNRLISRTNRLIADSE